MSATEFSYWRAYHRRSPFGPFRDNWNVAVLGSIIAKLANPKSKIKVSDLMWQDGWQRKAGTARETIRALMARAKKK